MRMLLVLFFREAYRALFRHKLRSSLTTLGITIGIAAVVLVVAIGQAGSERAHRELVKLGDNLVWIEAGSRNVAGARTGSHGTTSLLIEDQQAVLAEVPLIKRCSPQVDGNIQLIHGNRNWATRFRGETPDYLSIRKWVVAEGAPFSLEDVDQVAPKILLGETVRKQLFGAQPAVGELVRAQKQLFEVVGVLAPKGQSADGRDQDDWILLPYTTAEKRLRGNGLVYLDDVLCSAGSPEAVVPAIEQVTALLRQRHHLRPGEDDDFNIRRPDEVLKAQLESSRTLALLLVAVASIALLVGGIGVMNVMLAAVTQRTAEIGLRLAVGATERAVLIQFLGESVALCFVGGGLGLALSVAGAIGFERSLGWPISLSVSAIAVAMASAVATGLFFGLYPAWRAARLDPIAALHHE